MLQARARYSPLLRHGECAGPLVLGGRVAERDDRGLLVVGLELVCRVLVDAGVRFGLDIEVSLVGSALVELRLVSHGHRAEVGAVSDHRHRAGDVAVDVHGVFDFGLVGFRS